MAKMGQVVPLGKKEPNPQQADKAFGDAGSSILIEECLSGPELTVLAFTDGKTVVPMPGARDHKRALDGDLGKNTDVRHLMEPGSYALANTARD